MSELAGYQARHFDWSVADSGVATVRLNRPERKNPLTFDSYAELRDLFARVGAASDVKAVVFAANGGNFCSGGDVHEIIGPLVGMQMPELLAFTRMTGDLVKAMIGCRTPIVASVEGVCVGAGAIIAMARRRPRRARRLSVRSARPATPQRRRKNARSTATRLARKAWRM